MAVTVRRASADDADALAELHRALHEPHVRAMPEEYPPYDRAGSAFTSALRVLYVHQLAVADDVRGRGVGRALLTAAEQAAPGLRCSEVRLEHRAFNEEAHRFYASLGYAAHLVAMRKMVGA